MICAASKTRKKSALSNSETVERGPQKMYTGYVYANTLAVDQNRPRRPSTNQNAGNKFSTYERTPFASPTLAFQRARASQARHKSTQPINNMAAMMSINAVAPVRTPRRPPRAIAGSWMPLARSPGGAISDWKMLTGNPAVSYTHLTLPTIYSV